MLRRLRILALALLLVVTRALPFALGHAAFAAGDVTLQEICSVAGAGDAASGDQGGGPGNGVGAHCDLCAAGSVAPTPAPLALRGDASDPGPGCLPGTFQAQALHFAPLATGPPISR
jgi:hypothetical protein